ncbi:MAG: lysophospholipid acyltransferase family protein [Acidimicrobiia bacterium]|jgi:1-acyl-sn-glycerol-3-phosphate acyltransferase
MPDNPFIRRLITVPAVFVTFALLTVLSPLWIVGGAVVDIIRAIASAKPWMTLRGMAFLWVYLLGQIWALVGLSFTTLLPRRAKQNATFKLQSVWTAWNFAALRLLFSLDLDVEGQESAAPGPIVLLCRHASMVDTMLPARLVANPFGIRLRYVLKKELLFDPTLDIGGNRLPNYFIDRDGDPSNEIDALKNLARDLGPEDGILIYPEGTRYSESKRLRYAKRIAREGGIVGDLASHLRRVLPPRPGGTLAILETTTADIVVLAHRGLEGLATVKDIWSGGLVGSKINVLMWRIRRGEIPTGRRERVEWLYRLWAEVDSWIVSKDPVAGESLA